MSSGKARWLAVGAVVVAQLASCDGDNSDTGGDAARDSEEQLAASTGIDADRQPPAAPIEGAVEGGIVTASGWSGFDTLDPTEAYHFVSESILSGLVTRSLTQYVYDPELETMVLVPDIATDVGTPNDDFTEWTYTIRDGVHFEDGTVVTAEDVAYGIMRSFDRETFPGGPSYSNEHLLDGDTYEGPYRSGTDYAGVVVEGNTLTLKMERPFPDMPYWGAFPAMGPIPRTGSDPNDYRLHPLATGPYKVADYVPHTSLRLVRNDQWDPDTDPGRHAYPDEYHFRFDQPPGPVEAAILADSGRGQTTIRYDSVDQEDTLDAVADHPDVVTTGPIDCVFKLALDYRKITELEVRQAVGYAYPYDEVVAAAGQAAGVTVEYGTTLLPPGFPGWTEYNPLETQPGETDPDMAMAKLAEAGYEPGEYRLIYSYNQADPTDVAIGEALTAAFKAAGFQADPRPSANDTIYSSRQVDPDAPYNLRRGGWCTDWPSGDLWLPPQVSDELPHSNPAYFHESKVDAEIAHIRQLPLAEQPAAWGALDELIETEFYPYVVTGHPQTLFLHGSKTAGMNSDHVLGMPVWKDIHVVP